MWLFGNGRATNPPAHPAGSVDDLKAAINPPAIALTIILPVLPLETAALQGNKRKCKEAGGCSLISLASWGKHPVLGPTLTFTSIY